MPIKTYSNEVVTLWYRPPDVLLGSVEYSTPIDIWGVGCIFSEMVSGRPIFPGSTNEEQIVLIWQILGTPTESLWEGVSQLPEYKPEDWPECDKQDLAHQMPRLNRVGLELVDRMLQYNPKMRFTAQEAMAHPYFASLSIPKTLGPSKLRLATLHYLSSSLLLFYSFFFFLCGKHSRFIHISSIALSLVPCRTKLAERWGAAHCN